MNGFVDRLVLASASPRRREVLHQVGIPHLVRPSHVPELQQPGESPEAFVRRLATDKADAACRQHVLTPAPPPPPKTMPSCRYWFLGADTVVVLDDQVLGKPQDIHQAREYLELLQGTSHTVLTGYALLCTEIALREIGIDRSEVKFEPLSHVEIDLYLSLAEWPDAAGAYKIQGAAAAFVSSVQGSFPNVMGLPIHRICSILRDNQFRIGN